MPVLFFNGNQISILVPDLLLKCKAACKPGQQCLADLPSPSGPDAQVSKEANVSCACEQGFLGTWPKTAALVPQIQQSRRILLPACHRAVLQEKGESRGLSSERAREKLKW